MTILHAIAILISALSFVAAAHAQQSGSRATERVAPADRSDVMLSYAPVVKRVAPAVVNIYSRRTVQVRSASPLFNDPFFRRFFGDDFSFGIPRERVQGSLGSGVILRSDGVIVTNNHVIQNADSISVVLADRREFEAEVILADQRTDLAVLQIDTGGEVLPTVELSNSDDVQVGDIVLAIGNPFGIGQTVTGGIVSATARTRVGVNDFGFFIQTDAAVNPGNSGGALAAVDGRLIGINTAIYSNTGSSAGIGFAVPSNMVKSVVRAALDEGEIIRPWLGISSQSVTSELADGLGLDRPGGVLIDQVYPGGPADRAGLSAGDVILAMNGREVIDEAGLKFRTATAEDGEQITLDVLKDGERTEVTTRLSLPPENPPRNVTTLSGRNPFQGVTVGNLSPRFGEELGLDPLAEGVVVLEISRNSPAARRQFVRPGDRILAVNGQMVDRVADLEAAIAEPQNDWVYRLQRRGQMIECGILGNRSFFCRPAR